MAALQAATRLGATGGWTLVSGQQLILLMFIQSSPQHGASISRHLLSGFSSCIVSSGEEGLQMGVPQLSETGADQTKHVRPCSHSNSTKAIMRGACVH